MRVQFLSGHGSTFSRHPIYIFRTVYARILYPATLPTILKYVEDYRGIAVLSVIVRHLLKLHITSSKRVVVSNICRLIHEKRAPLCRRYMPRESDIRPPVCACALQVFISGFARMPPGLAAIPAPRWRPSKLVDSYFVQCQQ